MTTRPISVRLAPDLVKQLDTIAGAFDGSVTRTTVIEAACRNLYLRCPIDDCPFMATSPNATCPSHGRQLILP